MARKARLTCICYVEIIGANEYEALSEVEEMIEREYHISDKKTLNIKDCEKSLTAKTINQLND